MIKLENVSYIYSPKSPYECLALKNINFELSDHEFLFIVGETGSGKSTLIQHLNGLLFPSEGTVYVDEFVLTKDKKKATKKIGPLRKKVGVVFQFSENQLFQDTLEKDVAFGPLNFKVKEEEALRIAHESLNKVGLGEEYYKRSPFELSGGEKKKAAIAGILALNPDVLVLDEPTSGLDMSSRDEMMNLFLSLYNEGKSIIIVTHDMDLLLEYGQKVIAMKEGEVLSITSVHDLFYKEEDYPFLEVPPLVKLVKELKQKGLKIDETKIKNIPSLIEEIKRVKKKK